MIDTNWNITMVRAREARSKLPRRADDPTQIDWGEVEVAVIDTGYTRHRAFGPWMADHSPILRPSDGLNLIEPGALPLDPLDYRGTAGHGTRVISVLCGLVPRRFEGVAPGLPVIPYRAVNHTVLAAKSARRSVARAIRHAVDDAACEVISMSLGFPQLSLLGRRHLGEAVDHAYEHGVIMVAAGGQIIDRVTYPGRFFRTIGVGGVRPDRSVWFRYDANTARDVIDIWAPSDEIVRADSELVEGEVRDVEQFLAGDGTSYGTVHVAAAAAMWLAFHGARLDEVYPEPWQRIEAFRLLLAKTSSEIAGDYWLDRKKGILDIAALLDAPLPKKGVLKEETRKAAGQIF